MSYSKEEILRLAEENNVEFISLQFTDIFGTLKNVTIPVSQLPKALNNLCMFDGSSIEGFSRINESDQYLYPDLDTWVIIPWQKKTRHVTARLICDVYNPDGTPFSGDPRSLLKKVLKKATDMGYSFNVGPECEFFLFALDEKGKPTTTTDDDAYYFDLAPLDHGNSTREDICLALEDMGFEIEASHHESAAGQQEIDFKYADALKAADNIMTFKMVVKSLAQRHGLHATFMPKPVYGVNGSGMHVNMSLFKDGKNIFNDPNGLHGLSDETYYFIAGILNHVKNMTAITNPLVNSYKRLVPGYEAPCYVSWSTSNRSTLIRIPSSRGQSSRVELRSPDPSCNPYLALACCLAAGLDGLEKKEAPTKENTENLYLMSKHEREENGIESLPANLDDALAELAKDEMLKETLGEHIYTQYRKGKKAEWVEYTTQVSAWEVDKYLINY